MSTAFAPVPARTFLWRSRAWISLSVLAPAATVTVFSSPAVQIAHTWELAMVVAGWLLFCGGAVFRWWATLYIGGRKDMQDVICEGPYSVIRHPLYFGTFLMGVSVAFFLQSLVFAAALAFTAFVYLGITLPREEQRLIAVYGESYRSYMSRVPRFWPRWSNFRSPATIEVKVVGLRAELLRTARWMWVPLFAHLLSHLRHEAWWPHWVAIW